MEGPRVVIAIEDHSNLVFFYQSRKFKTNLVVTGYMIREDFSASDVFIMEHIGDGVYGVKLSFDPVNHSLTERVGIVVRENGKTQYFDVIQVLK